MKRRGTAQDLRMLTDVRDRLIAKRAELDRENPPRFKSGWLAPYRPRRTANESIDEVIDCNHGVPWTECTACSKPRSP